METLIPQIGHLLNNTLSPDHTIVASATETLDHLSSQPDFPFALISIASGGEDEGQRISAATYLKNFIRRNVDADDSASKVSPEFRNRLVHACLLAEPAILKVLVEAFRSIVVKEFVKENTWPELVPELRSVIQNSNYISESSDSQWKTINALSVLQSILRPFQYFLNPSLKKEPVPPQLELIAKEVLVPLLAAFHNFVEKVLSIKGRTEMDLEKILLLVCKCIYFSVRSHMPSALSAALPLFCQDLFRILESLEFNTTLEDDYLTRMKTGKRSLLIFRALVTRHRKHSDKLMPNIINCASKIVKQRIDISKLDFLSERVVSLAFDVISHVLETGPGWRLVSPHFSSLMDSAIFPALVLNEKDISEWEEDPDEYLRRNLPSDLEEISGWREDLFTARKSAINLLGVISMSKGPRMSSNSIASVKRKKSERFKAKELRNSMGELLVLPFLSKFRVPCGATVADANVSKEYYGVLMAYGGLQDFLRERNPEYTTSLVRTRVLPLYSLSTCSPYLVAAANWLLGELASCLPEDMSEIIYSSLLKALVMPDETDASCFPVRASAAGAIIELLENEYLPPEWLPLLQVVISRIDNEDDNESSVLFQLLSTIVETGNDNVIVHIPYVVSAMVGVISKHIPPIPEPWPQVVERGFSALAVMAQTLEDSMPEETEENEDSEKLRSGWATCVRAFSDLLTQAWLTPGQKMEEEAANLLPPTSCINDASIMLRSIMRFVTETKEILEMKVLELLTVWAALIADWHAWEELEDLSIFDCIKEVVYLCRKCDFKDFFVRRPLSPPVSHCSIIENIGAFVSEAITQYPSATWRACSCVHMLLYIPDYSSEIKEVQQSLVVTFSQAAFSHFLEVKSKPSAVWKPLLLVISSCYLCYPDIVEKVLVKDENNGFMDWASGLSYISTSSFEPGLSAESEIKLIVMALVKVVERLLGPGGDPSCGLVRDCFISLMEAVIRLKEIKEEDENEDEEADDDEEDEDEDEETDDDEDSEEDEREETEEEFLDRYAKASISLENGLEVEEGDIEDQDQELELGVLGEVDQESAALSLIERYNHIFMKGQTLPPEVITGFLNTFPEHASLFLHS